MTRPEQTDRRPDAPTRRTPLPRRRRRSLSEHPYRQLIVLLILACILGCSGEADGPPEQVVIGLLVDNDRPIHQPVLNAARLAIEDISRAGGLEINGRRLPVVLAVEDDIGSPEQAARAAYRLINQQRVSALIGCNLSRNAIPVGNVAQDVEIPMISPASTNPQTTQGRDYVFRVAFTDTVQGQMMARFAFRDLHLRRVAVLFNTAEIYSISVQEAFRLEFETLGGEVVTTQSYVHREDDKSESLRIIEEARPEALFLPNYTWDIIAIGRDLEALDIQIPLLGSEGWTTEVLADQPALDGAYVLQHWHSDAIADNLQAKRFVEFYTQQHGSDPFGVSALTFDAFGLLFQAVERAGSTEPDAIRRQLALTENFAGATGSITFRDQGGDPKKDAVIVRLVDGEVAFQRWIDP